MRIFILLIALCCSEHFLKAQDKEQVYSLQKDEQIAIYESTLGVYQSRLGFVFVIDNTAKNTRKYCVNKVLYDGFSRKSIEQPRLTNEHWGIIDSRADSNLVMFDGYRVAKYPKSKRTFDLRITKRLYGYVVYDEPSAEYNVIVNGFTYGPYINLLNYYLSPDGTNWAVSYYENAGSHYNYFIKFNNQRILGPYKYIYDFALLNNNQWVVVAQAPDDKEKIYIANQKGDIGYFEKKLQGQYIETKLIYTNQNYAMNVVKDQKIYFMVNGEVFGPYDDFVKQTDLGIKPDRFNYVVGKKNTLHFRDKPILDNVKKFTVSDSRNTIAIVLNNDQLNLNGKINLGTFKNIEKIDFPDGKEDFYFWTKENELEYTLYAYINTKINKLGSYKISSESSLPNVHFAPSQKNWGFSYLNERQEAKIVVDGKEYDTNFINEVSLYAQDGKEYAAWISLEGQSIILNKITFE
ncbi:MAG: hypothetical protein OHK0045_09450 [Raineya sp.]